jgi:NADPH-dependent 2,4-dienoyl-CoA reductase/sulfur reductase-like enzyme/rhodanese-related sulfurtransferase
VHNVLIIGGMAAGCKAAARLSRLSSNYQITIVEKSPFISFSSCGLPLYVSGELNEISELIKTSYGIIRDEKYFSQVKGVRVLTKTEVKSINAGQHEVECYNLEKNETFNLHYDSLLIATGSKIINPPFQICSSPLISPFHSPDDAAKLRQAVQAGKISKAVIVGAGFIGCELAESLSSLWGIETILIDKEESILPGCLDKEISAYAVSALKSANILLLLSTIVEKIELDAKGYPLVSLSSGQKITADYVFYCLGVKPDSDLAQKSNIKTGRFGGILVDENMRTSIPEVWAAGDCVEITHLVTGQNDYFSYGSLANRMGKAAADSITGEKTCFKGSAGTLSLKLFDTIISASGLSEKKALENGYSTGAVIGCWTDRPDYHPLAKNLLGKLIYDKSDLRLLGLQLIGEGEVTRYIDVFSDLLSDHKTVYDLTNLEHGYTPAHSSPVSILNNLGYMALNQEVGGIRNFNPLLFSSFQGICIDVRESDETELFPFPEKPLQIPLTGIRSRINDLKKDPGIEMPFLFICEKGPRAYEAARMFANNGFNNVAYLAGGNYLYARLSQSPSIGDFIKTENLSGCTEITNER